MWHCSISVGAGGVVVRHVHVTQRAAGVIPALAYFLILSFGVVFFFPARIDVCCVR